MDSTSTINTNQLHINEIISSDNACKHFCTASIASFKADEIISESEFSTRLKICEKYKPSYTSKKDQIEVISDRIKMIRQSKQLMRETMKNIDGVLDEKYKIDENNRDYEALEEFLRSKRCIHGSLHVTSLNSYLPRRDINQSKYIKVVDNKQYKNKTEKVDDSKVRSVPNVNVVPTSVFEPFDESTFTDKTILENRKRILEIKRKSQQNKRSVLSAGFSLVNTGKSIDSDRSANTKVKKLILTKSRINSAHK